MLILTFIMNLFDFYIVDKYYYCFSKERKRNTFFSITTLVASAFVLSIVNAIGYPIANLICSMFLIYLYCTNFMLPRTYYLFLPMLYLGLYCEVQEYNLLAMFNSVGCSTAVEDIAWDKILELARKHLIDVVVLQSMSRLSGNFEEIIEILDTLYSYGVKVDCMGYGILEQDVLYQYIEKRKRETQILEERILEIMLESMDEGMEG